MQDLFVGLGMVWIVARLGDDAAVIFEKEKGGMMSAAIHRRRIGQRKSRITGYVIYKGMIFEILQRLTRKP